MRNQIRRYVLSVTFVVGFAAAVPAMAASSEARNPSDLLARLKNLVVHVLDTLENKTTLPPG